MGLTITISFLPDTLLQHLWIHHRQDYGPFETYQELIERVKSTIPQQWNISVLTIKQILNHISYTLETSINLIKFKQKHKSYDYYPCHHTSHCYIPQYEFNPPFSKPGQKTNGRFLQLNILEFQNKYYSIPSNSCYPILINHPPNFSYNTLSKNDITNILHGIPVKKQFIVIIYSTTSFVRKHYTNVISRNVISTNNTEFLNNNTFDIPVLHLFLTPHLNYNNFDVYQLEAFDLDYKTFNQRSFNLGPTQQKGTPGIQPDASSTPTSHSNL